MSEVNPVYRRYQSEQFLKKDPAFIARRERGNEIKTNLVRLRSGWVRPANGSKREIN